MIKSLKVWGTKQVLWENSMCEIDILSLKKDTRCSWHKHQQKYNLFYLVNGSVGIRTEEGESILSSGELIEVQPGMFHEFRVYEDSMMIEIMYVNYDESDIERANEGGKLGKG